MIKNLESTVLFQEIGSEEIERMLTCSKSREKHYKAGEYIFRQGDKPTRIFLVLNGYIHIAKDFASGKRDVLYMENYWYDAVAAVDVDVLEIPWEFLYHFCENACRHHQLLTRNMLELFSRKEFHITKKLHIISTASLRERIAIWLIDSMDSDGKVIMRMKREELADFLGVARPSLSRELMRMQADGLIEVTKKCIYIKDKDSIEMLYG